MKNESARSSALDFACAGRKSMVDADNGPLDDVSTQPATLNTYKPKKPVLPAISTSYCSSPGILSSDGHISSSSSCSSSSSSAWPLTGSPTSPSSPDASYFSSSFSSTRSGFTDSSFTTVETVTTCTLSSEGGGRTGSAERPQRRQKKGRDDYQLNTFDMDIFGIPSRMQNTHTPASFRREESKQKESTYQQPISVANTLHSMSMPPDGRARMLLGFENTNTSQSSEARHNTMTLSFPEEISAFGREEDDSFADEGFVPDAIVKRGLEAQERLKFLRPAHTASRFIEDLRRSQDGSEGITQNSNVTESSLTRFEKDTSSGLLDSDNTFYDRFRPQLRFSGHRYNLPVCKRSFTSPALLSSSSSSSFFSPSTLGRKEDQTSSNMNRKEGNQSHSCTPTPSGSSTPRGDTYTSISPFELLNRVIAQEDEREVLIAEAAGKENSTATNVGVLPNNMDHYHLVDNHGIVFTQSTFDLRLHYEDNGTRTSIPLPQMSWFPEPPLKITSSSSSPSSELLSTSSSSLSKKQPSLFSSRPNALNKKKNYIRPATSDGIRAEGNRNILMNWNIRSRGKPRIGKNSIGYPVAST